MAIFLDLELIASPIERSSSSDETLKEYPRDLCERSTDIPEYNYATGLHFEQD